jgi:hypothetical protein
VTVEAGARGERQPVLEELLDSGRLFFVEFAGTPELKSARDWIREHGRRAEQIPIYDAGGRELIDILWVTANY